MKRIGVVFGGRSSEHEISLLSATAVIKAINKKKYEVVTIGITKKGDWKFFEGDYDKIADGSWEKEAVDFEISKLKYIIDFALPILHGPYGEDGTIQGLFEMLDLPYAGCGVLSSALCMDKVSAKEIFVRKGLPTSKYKLIYAEDAKVNMDECIEVVEASLNYNMFVKPSNMGSSVGISKVENRQQLKAAIIEATKYDRRIIVEEAVNCREIETGVIGNYNPQVAVVGEILSKAEFYDYTAKYSDDSGTILSIPAELPKEICDEVRKIARAAYLALDCSGFARVDCFVEKNTGRVYLNEINTIPGFTKYSMFPILWKEAGIPFGELVERIVKLGYERYNSKNNW